MNPAERIQKVMKYLNLDVEDFSRSIGRNRSQGIRDILDGKTKTIDPKFATLIIKNHPEISEVFLLTGKGDVTNKNYDNKINEDFSTECNINDKTYQTIFNLSESNRMLAQSNADLVAIIKEERNVSIVDEKVKIGRDEKEEFFVELKSILKSGSEREKEYYLNKLKELGVLSK